MVQKLSYFLLFYPILIFSLSCHESAHAWMANRFGDPTARLLGRISLNPLRHVDPIGTFLMPVLMVFTGARFLIGWAKPVPINPLNLKNPRRDALWISALGPFSNFALACVFALFGWAIVFFYPLMKVAMVESYYLLLFKGVVSLEPGHIICMIVIMGVLLNLALGFFNLIPIHPLDGGGVVRGLLPDHLVPKFDALAPFGLIIILGLLFVGALKYILIPVLIFTNLLLPI